MTTEQPRDQTVEEINQAFFGEIFNDNTVDYLAKSAGSRWFRDLLLMILEPVDTDDVATVVDVGCGIGHKTSTLRGRFPKASVQGFDFSPQAIEVATKAYGPEGIDFSCTDITKAGYSTRYDLIAAFDVLEHVDDWQGLVTDLVRANNRYIVLSFPVGRMRPYEVNIGHYRNFQRDQMERFMGEQGYATLKTFYAGFPFFSPIMRDLTQVFFKNYSETPNARMGRLGKLLHDVWYVLFRYGSLKHRGDVFIGLFEKSRAGVAEAGPPAAP
ncbi:MAG TPA: class I SAM-dependent methyltransferase [Acidimicrobiales bacterium]|nr:class I SAM-dependent methyltransferase [Acidimicrobiales bacterium]